MKMYGFIAFQFLLNHNVAQRFLRYNRDTIPLLLNGGIALDHHIQLGQIETEHVNVEYDVQICGRCHDLQRLDLDADRQQRIHQRFVQKYHKVGHEAANDNDDLPKILFRELLVRYLMVQVQSIIVLQHAKRVANLIQQILVKQALNQDEYNANDLTDRNKVNDDDVRSAPEGIATEISHFDARY